MKKFLALFLILSTVFCSSSIIPCFAENVEADSKKVEVVKESKYNLKELKEKYLNSKTGKTVAVVVSGIVYYVVLSYAQYNLIKSAVLSGLEEYNEKNSVISSIKGKLCYACDVVKSGVNDSIAYFCK